VGEHRDFGRDGIVRALLTQLLQAADSRLAELRDARDAADYERQHETEAEQLRFLADTDSAHPRCRCGAREWVCAECRYRARW
jgi:hypothetical protein